MPDISVTVTCRNLASAQKLSQGVSQAVATSLDVMDAEIAKRDLVISLIPYTHHATVIKSAICYRKNVVTTNYVSPVMLELDQAARNAGITVMRGPRNRRQDPYLPLLLPRPPGLGELGQPLGL
jgi:saccharopine dehydrogenase (NADP+, L-glutamate forming)